MLKEYYFLNPSNIPQKIINVKIIFISLNIYISNTIKKMPQILKEYIGK